MSYGIWRKRGKGWCSIEIDTPGNGTSLLDMKYKDPVGYRILVGGLDKHDVDYSVMFGNDDFHQLRWELNQTKSQPQREIVSYCPGGGEHVRWIAYDDEDSLLAALDAAEADDHDIKLVMNRAGYAKILQA